MKNLKEERKPVGFGKKKCRENLFGSFFVFNSSDAIEIVFVYVRRISHILTHTNLYSETTKPPNFQTWSRHSLCPCII